MAGQPPTIEVGPFGSVVDVPDPKQARPSRLFDARNMYVPDAKDGSAVLARHGFVGLTTQLGSVTERTGQGVHLHRSLTGQMFRYAFGGGRMYLWDGDETFTDITPAGISIDATNPVFCATFNDEVIVSDEQNKPWIYTPATGLGVEIEFNDVHDAWATKGGPVIYGGFVFFIVKASGTGTLVTEPLLDTLQTEDGLDLTTELTSGRQNQITWSNGLDPRTGYDQLDYDHVWELTQSSSDSLGGLYADEGALVYWRNVGIGYITGAVDDDFRTAATRDAISEEQGTDAPATIVSAGKKLYFADLDGRVFRCSPGGGKPEPLWLPMRRHVEAHVGTADCRTNVRLYGRASYHAGYGLVLFTLWDRTTLYAFDAATGRYVGEWDLAGGAHVTAMGALVDSANRSIFVMLGTRATTYQTADLGVLWRQKLPDDAMQWLDQADASQAVYLPLTRVVEPHWLAHKAALSFRALSATASLTGDVASHAVTMQYTVPGSGRSAGLVAQSSAVVGGESATDAISTASWGFGRNAQGSSIRCRLVATHADNVQFGVHALSVEVQVTKARPKAA